MKVILKQDVAGLGKKDAIVNVSDGYASNYLIPRSIAVAATPGNVNDAINKQKAAENKKKREFENASDLASKLQNADVTIAAKAGESGKLFGAVAAKDIADAVKKQYGLDIDKKKIVLKEPIKSAGEHKVEIHVYAGVSAVINVKVTV